MLFYVGDDWELSEGLNGSIVKYGTRIGWLTFYVYDSDDCTMEELTFRKYSDLLRVAGSGIDVCGMALNVDRTVSLSMKAYNSDRLGIFSDTAIFRYTGWSDIELFLSDDRHWRLLFYEIVERVGYNYPKRIFYAGGSRLWVLMADGGVQLVDISDRKYDRYPFARARKELVLC